MRSTATDPTTQPGPDPAEGRPEMDLPGADRDARPGPDREDDLPMRLGERIEDRQREGGTIDEPDLLPNVEIPAEQM